MTRGERKLGSGKGSAWCGVRGALKTVPRIQNSEESLNASSVANRLFQGFDGQETTANRRYRTQGGNQCEVRKTLCHCEEAQGKRERGGNLGSTVPINTVNFQTHSSPRKQNTGPGENLNGTKRRKTSQRFQLLVIQRHG